MMEVTLHPGLQDIKYRFDLVSFHDILSIWKEYAEPYSQNHSSKKIAILTVTTDLAISSPQMGACGFKGDAED